MRIKDGFIVKEIAGAWVAVPLGVRTVEVNGLVTLSETGAFLWDMLSKQDVSVDNLAQALVDSFEVDKETAVSDVNIFLEGLRIKGLIIE